MLNYIDICKYKHSFGLYISDLCGYEFRSLINYVKDVNNVVLVFEETVNNLLANFSNILNGSILTLKGAGIIGAAFMNVLKNN